MRSANYYVTHRDDAISTDWQCTNLFLHINVDAGWLAPGDLLENVINMEFTLKLINLTEPQDAFRSHWDPQVPQVHQVRVRRWGARCRWIQVPQDVLQVQ